jgi:hypothetical protein
MLKAIFLACLFVLIYHFSASADAAQPGRIISEVNFREGPSRSTRIIGRLPAGASVQIVKREPAGWYLVNVGGRRGFVYEKYLTISQPVKWSSDSKRLGAILISIGLMLILHYFFPFISKTAALLIGSFVSGLVADLVFQMGILYSFFAVVLGLLIAVSYLIYRKQSRAVAAAEKPQIIKKASDQFGMETKWKHFEQNQPLEEKQALQLLEKIGATRRIRTADLLITNQLLYRLS